jgi:hypothetical protein
MQGNIMKAKEDTHNSQGAVKKLNKGTHPRTSCTTHIYIKRKDAWFYVEDYSDEYNHPLLIKSSLTRFLCSHWNTTRREGILETAMGVQHSYMPADAAHVKIIWEA